MEVHVRPQQSPMWTFLSFCPICDKTFTREDAYNRHVSYCRRARTKRKGRPKACTACNSSKTRCSFARPQCTRCNTKGLECVYDWPGQLAAAAPTTAAQNGRPHQAAEILHLNMDNPINNRQQDNWLASLPSSDVLGPSTLQLDVDKFTDSLNSAGLDSFSGFIEDVVEWETALDASEPTITPSHSSSSSSNIYISPPTRPLSPGSNIIARSRNTASLARIQQGDLAANHAANLISHIVSAFPLMMLRRNTFPPFIHPYWYQTEVPQKLAGCMSIAQLFVSRTPESRPFLWRTIEAEQQHFRDELHTFTAYELQQAIQAISIYTIMAIIDQDEETPARGARLMQTFLDLKLQFADRTGFGLTISETEASNPSPTWEQWIFAESRRRTGCLWFAITRVFALKVNRATCSSLDNFLEIPLSSSKTAWEARTREEWEAETRFADITYPITTFGELIAARRQPGDPVNAHKLVAWEAGADKLGMMINIAVELAGVS